MSKPGYYDMGIGCSDGGCIFRDNSRGMHTNGGCGCVRDLQRCGLTGVKVVQLVALLRKDLVAALDGIGGGE